MHYHLKIESCHKHCVCSILIHRWFPLKLKQEEVPDLSCCTLCCSWQRRNEDIFDNHVFFLAFKSDAASDSNIDSSGFTTIRTGGLPDLPDLPFPAHHCLLVLQLQIEEDGNVSRILKTECDFDRRWFRFFLSDVPCTSSWDFWSASCERVLALCSSPSGCALVEHRVSNLLRRLKIKDTRKEWDVLTW